ncbi:DNA-binding transcriptional LysR family regulator [Rhodococcus sp. OK519]|nr:DNA-binding transcriptional LysR family regulator [Rhodococcus sp. OK519]
MAQPALSQAIRRVERRLGVELFSRTSRHVEPTLAGRVLASHARQILHDVQRAVADAQVAGGNRTLSVHVTEPSLRIPRQVLAAVRRDVPSAAIHQTTLPHRFVPDKLRAGELSLSIGNRITGPDVTSVLLCHEPVVVVMAAHHPLAACETATIAQLAEYPLVSIDDTMSTWNQFVEHMLVRENLVPLWTSSSSFGAAAGADLVADGRSLLVCLASVGDEQPSDRVSRPLRPAQQVGWFLSWRTATGELPLIRKVLAAAVRFHGRGVSHCTAE